MRNWLVYYVSERLAASWTDGLIVMNSEDLQNAEKLGFRLGENLFYVHGVGVDLDYYGRAPAAEPAVRRELGIHSDDLVVTCVAELIRRKNHLFLLEAWRRFSQKVGNAHLLLVGGGDATALQDIVVRKRINRVYFLGRRDDVPDILQATDIAVLVSRQEGLPRFLMEAMAASRPVVASDVRGNCDLVEHGRTGFLVGLGDVAQLATALENLASDRELRAKMGTAGRDKILDYSLEHVIAEMARVYCRYLS